MIIMEEIWKDVEGYSGIYKVSNFGRIWSNYKKELKVPQVYKSGYLFVTLYKNGKGTIFLIHRLVALAFVPGWFEGAVVNHKDEDKTNNRVDNLEWCDQRYNNNYNNGQKRRADTKRLNDYHHSIETRIKLSESHRGKPNKASEIKVNQYTMSGEYIASFDSVRMAAKHIGLKAENSISNVLHGRSKSAGGYKWSFNY